MMESSLDLLDAPAAAQASHGAEHDDFGELRPLARLSRGGSVEKIEGAFYHASEASLSPMNCQR